MYNFDDDRRGRLGHVQAENTPRRIAVKIEAVTDRKNGSLKDLLMFISSHALKSEFSISDSTVRAQRQILLVFRCLCA